MQRAAFVGDQKWVKWLTHIMSPFTRHTEEQYFEPEEIQKAWIWACGKSDEEG